MNQRDAFVAALDADPYDEVTHKVFADWLDEHDEPELACLHRSWTKEWQEAKDWITRFAARGGSTYVNYDDYAYDRTGTVEPEYQEITYDVVMSAAKEWIDTCGEQDEEDEGEYWCQQGSESLRDMMCEGNTHKEFWKNYQIVTKTEVPAFKQGQVFTCSC